MKDLEMAIKHCEEVVQEKRYEYQECVAVHDMEEAMNCGKCGQEHEQLAKWLKELKKLREQTRWIPVSKRLPKDGEDVIIYYERNAFNDEGVFRKKEIGVGWHINRLWHVDGCSRVEGIAWMPLPKPYEPQKSEEV